MTTYQEGRSPMTHLIDQDNQESVTDHAPAGLVARSQTTAERGQSMAKWVEHKSYTYDPPGQKVSASIMPNPEGGWDGYVTPWGGRVARVCHQLTLDSAVDVCEAYMARTARNV